MTSCYTCKTKHPKFYCGSCAKQAYCSQKCALVDWTEKHSFECIGLQGDDDVVGLESGDGYRIQIPRATAMQMLTIQYLIEDAGVEEYIPVPNVDGQTLQWIERFAKFRDFEAKHLSNQDFFNLIVAADYLDYQELLAVLIRDLAKRLIMFPQYYQPSLQNLIPFAVYFLRSFQDVRLFTDRDTFERRFKQKIPWRKFLPNISVFQIRKKVYDYETDWAIIYASTNGYADIVKMLLQYPYVDPTVGKNLPIRRAAENGHVEVVRLLLQDSRVDPAADYNYAIEYAVKNGHTEVVRLLLQDDRVDPEERVNSLIQYPATDGYTEIVRLLLQHPNVDPTANDNHAILFAVKNNHVDIVRLLLQDGRADPAAFNNYAINYAAEHGYVEVVHLLLQDQRVNPAVDDNYPIRQASDHGHVEIVKLLLQHPSVDPAAKNNSAIRVAAWGGQTDVVRLLLQDPRVTPANNDTNFVAVISNRRSHLDVVQLLLEDGRTDFTRIDLSDVSPETADLIQSYTKRRKIGDYYTGNIQLPSPFRVRVITWNMGDNKKDQLAWAGELRKDWELITKKDYEILFLTVQEDRAKNAFGDAVLGAIGKDYDLIRESTWVPGLKFSIKGYVFTHRTLKPFISQTKTEKTCLQTVCTKSTVGISLVLGEQMQFIFMGSHFPINTKKEDLGFDERVKAGQKSLLKVFNQLRQPNKPRFAAFWAGDLNFRGTAQLSRARTLGSLGDFKEEPINFPPTCKMSNNNKGTCDRKKSDTNRLPGCYDTKREPSWCDRILYNSSSDTIVPLEYNSYADAAAIQESDHNLVYANYKIKM